MLLKGHTQLIVKSVMPDLLHVIPVGDGTMLSGVLTLALIAYIGVLLAHAHQHTLVLGVPSMEVMMALGASSSEKPGLHV